MNLTDPLALLGGLSAQRFMRRHWQKKPLLVRGALAPQDAAVLTPAELLRWARAEQVSARLVERPVPRHGGSAASAVASGSRSRGNETPHQGWRLRHGPLRRLPSLRRPGWTVLVQGVDLLEDRARGLLDRFRFVPDARLDDLMVSLASDGGGVGPHVDSYDVFLVQAYGKRRWRWGRQRDAQLVEGLPLKILQRFDPEEEALLDPGDLLYLPPGWAHDGVAEGVCMTCSVGFRAPSRAALARELLLRLCEDDAEPGPAASALFRDAGQPPVAGSARVPAALGAFAADAVRRAVADAAALDRALGEWLTEPAAQVVFEPRPARRLPQAVRLDRRSRMLWDTRHLFLNGDSWHASGRDAALMRRLADRRRLDASDLAQASPAARALLLQWLQAGWLQPGQADR